MLTCSNLKPPILLVVIRLISLIRIRTRLKRENICSIHLIDVGEIYCFILELYSELYSREMIHWDDPLQRKRDHLFGVTRASDWSNGHSGISPGGPGSEFIKQLILDYLVVIKLEPTWPKNPTQNLKKTQPNFQNFNRCPGRAIVRILGSLFCSSRLLLNLVYFSMY